MAYTWSSYTGAGTQNYNVIACSSDGTKIATAVASGGYIYTSTNSGATFTQRLDPGTATWNSISMSANGLVIVACGTSTNIWISTNGGANWSGVVVGGSTKNWIGSGISTDGATMYVSNADGIGATYKSTDTGASWTPVSGLDGTVNYGIALSADNTIVYATAQNSTIRKSIDSGSTWNPLSGAGNRDWRDIATSSDGTYVVAVASTGGNVWISQNGGTTWSSTGTSQNWNGCAMSSDGSKMFACGVSTLYYSDSFGSTWSTLTVTGTPSNMRQVAISSDAYRVAVAGSGQYVYLGIGPAPIICFREGSKICVLNPMTGREEYVPVERMRPGTLVKTHMSGYVPVSMIGTSTVTIPEGRERTSERLYVCSKEQFPELIEDLYITGRHSILVESLTDVEREACAEDLGRVYVTESKYRLPAHIDRRAQLYEAPGAVERIWHFALENNDEQMNYGVYANGLLVESCSIWRLRTMVGYTIMDSRSQVYIVGDEGDTGNGVGVGVTGLLQNTARPIVC